jgi:hypothetical protein
MPGKKWEKGQGHGYKYELRTEERERVLMLATMDFVAYFMGLGDDQATAESKVSQVSTDVAALLYVYTLGNTQPLLDAIQASTLPHMDQAAKDKLIGDLTITP